MEAMRTADVLKRIAAAVVLALVTGVAVALLAQLAEGSGRHTVDYVIPNEYSTQTGGQAVPGQITDPRR